MVLTCYGKRCSLSVVFYGEGIARPTNACFPCGTPAAFVGLVSGEDDEEEEMDL